MTLSRKAKEIEARRAADPLAQKLGREDIDYSSDELPTAPRITAEPIAAFDEPSFTVFAHDPLAQGAVLSWIERAEAAGVPKRKIESARRRYDEIVEFQSDHPELVRIPD